MTMSTPAGSALVRVRSRVITRTRSPASTSFRISCLPSVPVPPDENHYIPLSGLPFCAAVSL